VTSVEHAWKGHGVSFLKIIEHFHKNVIDTLRNYALGRVTKHSFFVGRIWLGHLNSTVGWGHEIWTQVPRYGTSISRR